MEEGPLSGTLDISYLHSGWQLMDEIWEAEGDKVTIDPSDSWSYTYIGLNPQKVNVGGDPGSEASKYLRRAFCTIFGVYRSAVVGQYPDFGSIQQPCSNTFWISADQETQAFSKDLNGTELYTADMTEAQRYEAAANAALDYLEAAGYTVSGGKVTSAPEGASLTYEIQATGMILIFIVCSGPNLSGLNGIICPIPIRLCMRFTIPMPQTEAVMPGFTRMCTILRTRNWTI